MAREVRAILDCLDGQMLRKLCEVRGLPVSGSVDEKRNRLSRSFANLFRRASLGDLDSPRHDK